MIAFALKTRRRVGVLLLATLFAMAMGYLEAVVVVYLRSILSRRADWQAIEVTREFATLVMLVTFALIAGRNARSCVGVFLLLFGMWDLVYYAGLKIWLNWPGSLMTVDTLFYIPCTWKAPVYFPILSSCLMVLLGARLYCETELALICHSWRWCLSGWLAGCLGGVVVALLEHLPMAASVMGLSALSGLVAAGMGVTAAMSGRSLSILPALLLSLVTGAVSGWLGHTARSMFYASTVPLLSIMALASILNLLVLAYGRSIRSCMKRFASGVRPSVPLDIS